MILDKKVNVYVSGINVKYYKDLGYNFENNSYIDVDISHLPLNSSFKIKVSCEVCESIREVKYQNYNNQLKKGGYYCCTKCSRNKIKETCTLKYGFDNPMKSKEILNKAKTTNLKKYGFDSYSKTEQYKEKFRTTNLFKYGVNNPMHLKEFKDKLKQTCLEKYGVNNVMLLDYIKFKIEKTCLNKYGVSNFSKLNIPKINSKFFNNIMYQSSYELDFIKYCFENKLKIERGKSFKYYFENKEHTYHSDFFLPELNLICEVKSNYTLNYDLKRNLVKKECVKDFNFVFLLEKDYTVLENYLINKKR